MMKTKTPLSPLLLIILTALLLAGCAGPGQPGRGTPARLGTGAVQSITVIDRVEGSGTLEPLQEASLAWKTTGTVAEVRVQAGDRVRAGDVLLTLDPTSAPASVIAAQADLVTAQKALDDLLRSDLAQAQARQALDQAEQALADLEEDSALRLAQAREALIAAQNAYSDTVEARDNLDSLRDSPSAQDARETYETAEAEVERLRRAYESLPGDPGTNPAKGKALMELKLARFQRDRAKAILDRYGSEPTEREREEADSRVALALAKLAEAQTAYDRVKDGPDPAAQALLEAQLSDARRAYARQENGPHPDDVAAARARLQAAQATVNSLSITAPFEGEVLSVEQRPGDVANTGAVAVRLANRARYHVDVLIDETEIGQVHPGDPAEVTLDAHPGAALAGAVAAIDPSGKLDGGVVKYRVEIELEDPGAALLLGATANVSLQTGQPAASLAVPVSALQTDAQGEFVQRLSPDGSLERVDVTSWDLQGDLVIVTGPLAPGDQVQLAQAASMDLPGGGMFGQN